MGGDAFAASQAMAAAASRQDYSIQVTLPNIPLWVPDAAKAAINALVLQTVRLVLQDAAGHIADEAGKFADTGNLAQSFGSDPATAEGGIDVLGRDATAGINGRVFSSLPYAVVMNDGRRPGAPISREGIDAIGLWAQRKLGLNAKEADRAKWAIAASIIAQGHPGYGYFEDGFNTVRPRAEFMFNQLSEQITAQLLKPGS
jgi:hypothetical protein